MEDFENNISFGKTCVIYAKEKSKVGALLLFLVILFQEVNPLAYTSEMDNNPPNIGRIIWSLVFLFAFYGVLYLPETFLKRPSPIFWKAIQGVGVFYLVSVVTLLLLVRMLFTLV